MGNNCRPSLKVSSSSSSSIDETKLTKSLTIDINATIVEQPRLYPAHSVSLSKSLCIEYDRASVTPLPHLTARLSSRASSSPLLDLGDPFSVCCVAEDCVDFPDPDLGDPATKSSSVGINNGITGTHISGKICTIAATFWQQNIDTLPMAKKIEVASAVFVGALSGNAHIKAVMDCDASNLEQKSLKLLDMFGWLVRYLMVDGVDLLAILARLGIFHQRMGIKMQHFESLLLSMHDVFGDYFPIKYDIEVKYAFDEVYTLAAQIMTGEDLKTASHLNKISESFEQDEIEFLRNLDDCLRSAVGRAYLYRFLKQTFCDELVLFLNAVHKFKTATTPQQRLMIARDIVRVCIESDAEFALNLSFECRQNMLDAMQLLEQKFTVTERVRFTVHVKFFDEVDREVRKLIFANHWGKFRQTITKLQSQSFCEN